MQNWAPPTLVQCQLFQVFFKLVNYNLNHKIRVIDKTKDAHKNHATIFIMSNLYYVSLHSLDNLLSFLRASVYNTKCANL
eukprot:Gb_02872 [translate_table: standard]